MTELAGDREAVLATIAAGITEEEAREAEEAGERSELLRRRQAIAPEALAGDPAAVSEWKEIEARLAVLDLEEKLRVLASYEEGERNYRAAVAENTRQREQWRIERAEVEASRDERLAKIERAITTLVDLIPEAIRLDAKAADLEKAMDPERNPLRGGARAGQAIKNRLSRRFAEVGMRAIDYPLSPNQGCEALGAPTCLVCAHDQRGDIDAALAAGEPVRALEERFGVSRSTLSRHRGHASASV